MTFISKRAAVAGAVISAAALAPISAPAQHLEGDTSDPIMRWGRMMAEPGTFWLDSNDDREIIRYTQPRDVRLCLPRPKGVNSAEEGRAIKVTWDQVNTALLMPGNCLFFDAKRVKLKPAESLPSGVTLTGRVETESALVK